MNSVDKAIQTQKENIQKKTGKSLEELFDLLNASGLKKFGELRQFAIDKFSLGYGDATMLVQWLNESMTPAAGKPADPLDEYYAGKNAGLRPIHEKIIDEIDKFGLYEIAPKKTYVSLRRKRQFAMLGPGTRGRIELGLNMKGIDGTDRLISQPPGGMCQYKVFIAALDEIDQELLSWLHTAYESAG